MQWFNRMRRRVGMSLLGGTPFYDGIGGSRRALAWQVGNPGAVAALAFTQNELRAKSRDLVRRNAWAAAGVEAFVSNAIGTGIKPQSMLVDQSLREANVGVDTMKIFRRAKVRVRASASEIASPSPSTSNG